MSSNAIYNSIITLFCSVLQSGRLISLLLIGEEARVGGRLAGEEIASKTDQSGDDAFDDEDPAPAIETCTARKIANGSR